MTLSEPVVAVLGAIVIIVTVVVDLWAIYFLVSRSWRWLRQLPQKVRTAKFWENTAVAVAVVCIAAFLLCMAVVALRLFFCIVSAGVLC